MSTEGVVHPVPVTLNESLKRAVKRAEDAIGSAVRVEIVRMVQVTATVGGVEIVHQEYMEPGGETLARDVERALASLCRIVRSRS